MALSGQLLAHSGRMDLVTTLSALQPNADGALGFLLGLKREALKLESLTLQERVSDNQSILSTNERARFSNARICLRSSIALLV
jgi:hypothetical protein